MESDIIVIIDASDRSCCCAGAIKTTHCCPSVSYIPEDTCRRQWHRWTSSWLSDAELLCEVWYWGVNDNVLREATMNLLLHNC
jgi:hypothetical protein